MLRQATGQADDFVDPGSSPPLAEWARYAPASAGDPGRRRMCTHPLVRHLHGTRVAYVRDRCRCAPCRAANAAASSQRRRQVAYGRWQPFVDAAPAAAHVAQLRAGGMGIARIARATGLSASHVRSIAESTQVPGRCQRRVRDRTARRVLLIELESASPSPYGHVLGPGTRRRIQALVAVGWPEAAIAAELGRTVSSLRRTMASDRVTARTAREVDEVYERLWRGRRGADATEMEKSAAVVMRAERLGWQPPLAWDDIDRDPEPAANRARAARASTDIDEIAIERAVSGDSGIRLSRAEVQRAIADLTNRGESIRDIALTLGVSARTVSRRRLAGRDQRRANRCIGTASA